MNAEPLKIGEQESIDLKDCILLGKLVGVWGVKGWLKVFSYTRPRKGIGQYKRWLLVSSPLKKHSSQQHEHDSVSVQAISVPIKNCKEQGQNVVAQIEGVHFRDQAETLLGLEVYIEKTQLKPLKEGEFYWSDMIGSEVTNLQGEILGVVSTIMETGANDVLVVHQKQENEITEHLIPYSDEVVLSVNVSSSSITVDWGADYLVTEKEKNPKKKKQTKQERIEEVRLEKLAIDQVKSKDHPDQES